MWLHQLAWWCHGPGKYLGPSYGLAWYLGSPVSEVVGYLELRGSKLDTSHFPDALGEFCWEATYLPTEDHLQGLALCLVGLLVDGQAHCRFGYPAWIISCSIIHSTASPVACSEL